MTAETIFLFPTTATGRTNLGTIVVWPKLRLKPSDETSGGHALLNWLKELTETSTANPSQYVRVLDEEFALEQAASKADEAAFLRVARDMDWSTRPAQDYVSAIRLALQVGAHGFARQLSKDGGKKFLDHAEMQKLAALLASSKIVSERLPADPRTGLNMRWLKEHRDEYHGQWVALRAGELLFTAPTAKALLAHLEDPKEKSVLVTKVY